MLYDDKNRGRIQNRERARQIIDFSDLRYGNITPTDIDGFIEYQDKARIFYEFKYKGAELPNGQRIALERAVDDMQKAGKEATALLCEHYVQDCEQDINAANAIVRKYYYNHRWFQDGKRTVKQVTDSFLSSIKYFTL